MTATAGQPLSLASPLERVIAAALAARVGRIAREVRYQATLPGATMLPLRRGMYGQEVRRLQRALGIPEALADGKFGPQTEAAVLARQERLRGIPTGVADAVVQKALGTEILLGVDVSHWQGTVDWPRLRAKGVRWAALKASQRGTARHFRTNLEGARSATMATTAYHFADTNETPGWNRAQLMTACGLNYDLDLPPVLDLEDRKFKDPPRLVRWALATGREFADATGRRPILYSSYSFLCDHLAGSRNPARWSAEFRSLPDLFHLWIVRYNGKPDPGDLGPFTEWILWQWSNRGVQAAGLTGCVESKGLDVNWMAGGQLRRLMGRD
jgi:GH25 family lysozyme M1 (1,4-beta-N-acetylmuramidase)